MSHIKYAMNNDYALILNCNNVAVNIDKEVISKIKEVIISNKAYFSE